MVTSKWLKWLVIGGVALLVLGIGFSILSPAAYGRTGNWAYDNCGMWGGRGMMDNWGGTGMMGYRAFGWLGMLPGLLIPLGFISLFFVGGIWLVRAVTSTSSPLNSAKTEVNACPSCGQNIQVDWRNCPHCGAMINQ